MGLVLMASVVGSFGAVLLKAGSAHLREGFLRIFNRKLALGVFFFLASSWFFVAGIRHGQLSVLYPMVSLGNIWTMIWSRIFFREPITRFKIAGLLLILIGVFFIGLGNS
jgi:drug/metabolite transporter (DMT)-like permease